jgi:hypothetical protein
MPQATAQLQLEPLCHALRLDDDLLGGKRRTKRRLQGVGRQVLHQRLQTIAFVENETHALRAGRSRRLAANASHAAGHAPEQTR